jgi:hypothetical protein
MEVVRDTTTPPPWAMGTPISVQEQKIVMVMHLPVQNRVDTLGRNPTPIIQFSTKILVPMGSGLNLRDMDMATVRM